jgi:hypothetical protein
MKRLLSSVVIATALGLLSAGSAQAQTLPERLSDAEFWKLANDVSEPGGFFFRMDNFTSNEPEIGPIIGMLRAAGRTGGVFIGVGPEQNFSYVAALKPKMAFIVDIRRQAAIQHLMYKAIFEMSPTRADFVSMLFSKPKPDGLDADAAITAIWNAFSGVRPDSAAYRANLERIMERLTRTRGFTLTPDEVRMVDHVFQAFFAQGPAIGGPMVDGTAQLSSTSFASLTSVRDNAGVIRSFLDSESSYLVVRDLHDRNLIVPVTGDFGGPKAIRAVGDWLRARRTIVTEFYVSNVEEYLFKDNIWQEFYGNVTTLPMDSTSLFIRPNAMRSYPASASVCPIAEFLTAFNAGRVTRNEDALRCAR